MRLSVLQTEMGSLPVSALSSDAGIGTWLQPGSLLPTARSLHQGLNLRVDAASSATRAWRFRCIHRSGADDLMPVGKDCAAVQSKHGRPARKAWWGGDGAGQDVLGTEDAAAAARLQGGIAMEISGHDSVMTPEGVYIIGTYDENGVPNAMNATWGVQCGEGKIAFFLGTHKTPRISRPKAPSRFSLQRQTLSRSRTISALPRETS